MLNMNDDSGYYIMKTEVEIVISDSKASDITEMLKFLDNKVIQNHAMQYTILGLYQWKGMNL